MRVIVKMNPLPIVKRGIKIKDESDLSKNEDDGMILPCSPRP